MRLFALSTVLALLSVPSLLWAEFADAQRETITFSSGRLNLTGYLYRPQGKGPFPAVVWVHGRPEYLKGTPRSEYNELAKLYTREGFVLLVPDRRMNDISRADYSPEFQKQIELEPNSQSTKDKRGVDFIELNAQDVRAAANWLKQQTFVDRNKIVLSGWSFGASLCLLAAENNHDYRALVLFSPAMTQWDRTPVVRPTLVRAAQNCTTPVFMIRSTDDVSLKAWDAIGSGLSNKPANKKREYAHGGFDGTQSHALAVNDCDSWGYDVLRFFESAVKD
jgi:dienelactone hydrolase